MVSSNQEEKASNTTTNDNESTLSDLVQRRNALREKLAKAVRQRGEKLKTGKSETKNQTTSSSARIIDQKPIVESKDVTTAPMLAEITEKEEMQQKVVADRNALLARVRKLMTQQKTRVQELSDEINSTNNKIGRLEQDRIVAQEELDGIPATLDEISQRQGIVQSILHRNEADMQALRERYGLAWLGSSSLREKKKACV